MKMSVDGTQYPISAARIDLEVNSHVDTKIITAQPEVVRVELKHWRASECESERKKENLYPMKAGNAIEEFNQSFDCCLFFYPLMKYYTLG